MTIQSCCDCKHFRPGGGRAFFSHCARYDAPAPDNAWVYGVERVQLVAHVARSGPCGKKAQGFEPRPPTWWQRVKLALAVVWQ